MFESSPLPCGIFISGHYTEDWLRRVSSVPSARSRGFSFFYFLLFLYSVFCLLFISCIPSCFYCVFTRILYSVYRIFLLYSILCLPADVHPTCNGQTKPLTGFQKDCIGRIFGMVLLSDTGGACCFSASTTLLLLPSLLSY